MPIYEFQCLCGLRFEKSARMEAHSDPKPCPSCGAQADRVLPDSIGYAFCQPVSGPTPQNTGLDAVDANLDRVIGQAASQGWETQERRVSDKRAFLQANPWATGYDLSQNPDGSWSALKPQQRQMKERAQTINSLAMSFLRQQRTRNA